MSQAITASQERSMLHQNNTAPRSTQLNSGTKKNNGFLSTLASYLTSTAKSDPKPIVIPKKPLMTSWDDVDFVKLNKLVCNVLYEPNNHYEPLISEIERVVGRRREHCFYAVVGTILVLILLHDAVGAITAFMTLLVPTFMTISSITSTSENSEIQIREIFFIRYWTVYAVFVTGESFLASLIQWDLRLFRLVFMSMCLSTRIPVLAASYAKIIGVVTSIRETIDSNNIESPKSESKKTS
ncbi:hypothetical protein L5515_013645 [Caenorhabditis briggsae]|uniref:Receptor expression-enhancing protein n=1 Tax=Caenorhabditis briggsae TaxID=6238 RepID=A0AAE9EB77_CAEBR|nr:hypothetical protein L5515_013645 [Caenorhabditis briggsae]